MKRPLVFASILILAALLAVPATVAADDTLVRIASGRKGFTYRSVYAANLQKLMRGYRIVFAASEGSGENLDLLASGKAEIAFAQADVFAEKLALDPERYRNVLPVGRIAPECVYIAVQKAGPKKTLEGLAGKAMEGDGSYAVIAAGDANSGMVWTWAYMGRLVEGLSQVRVDNTSGTLALNQLALGSLDAVGWVTDPNNADQKMLRAAQANDRLELMHLDDPALLAPMADGTKVYEARTISLGKGPLGRKLKTICTSAVLYTRKDASPQLIEKLSDLVSLEREKIVPRKKK